jgi:phosphopantothenoylcysteine synthetase/decarboxylase
VKILITSGGCKVPIDDVRHIGNFSSGRYGAELADAFLDGGNEVVFFSEKGSLQPTRVTKTLYGEPFNFRSYVYKDYHEYLAVKDLIKREQPDIIVSAAAISDYILDKTEGKISSDSDNLIIRLRKGEKVIKSFRELAPDALIVGFKLLVGPTPEEKFNAIKKVLDSADLVVFNDLIKLRTGDSNRQVFSKHLGTLTEYGEEHAHNCKSAASLMGVINEYAAHKTMERLFGEKE